ncbi:FtsX-like permease family protein [Eubacterium sp.]|uniref:FtsX-like permease family protein n=1 Tax=Eubacterium sp. TaxID=142586 RepID=UPI0025FF15A2|nr:FtsX-like permease family protein [Eubacterium sp.]MCR5630134.1 hypothetical protein [Eubacterium sp.]
MNIRKRIIREFKGNIARYLGIFFLVIASISIMSAFICSSDSMEMILTKSQKECNVEDGNIHTSVKLEKIQLDEINNLGIKIENEMYIDIETGKEEKIRLFKNRDEINEISLNEGKLASSKKEIVLDPLYAKAHDVDIKDKIEIDEKKYEVVGIGCVPEYVYILEQYSSANVDSEKFGLGFVCEEQFDEYDEGRKVFNYSYIGNIKKLKKYLDEKNISYAVMEKKNNPRIGGVFDKVETDKKMGMVIGLLVVVIIAFILAISGKKKVEEECKEIGTLYAMGYLKRELIINYIILPTVIIVIGSFAGWIIGTFGLTKSLTIASYSFYCAPKFALSLKMEGVIVALVCPFILVIIINYIILNKALNVKPLRMLQNDLKKENVRELNLSRGSFNHRFKIRILLNEIGNYLVLIAGVAIAIFMMVMGLGMHDSIEYYVDDVKDTIICENIYMLRAPVEVDEKCEKIYTKNLDCYYKTSKKDMGIAVVGMDDESKYLNGKTNNLKENEIILSDATAKKFELKKNDYIELKNPDTGKKYKLKIVEKVPYATGLYAFMKRTDLNEMLEQGKEDFNGYMSDKKLSIDETFVDSVMTRESLEDAADNYMGMVSARVYMLIGFGVMIFVMLLFIILKHVIEKNVSDISLVKILGYLPHEIKKLYFGSTFWVFVFALIIAVPIDNYLMKNMWPSLNATLRGFIDFRLSISSALICLGLGMISYACIYVVLNKKIDGVSMTESLKGRE